MSETIRNMSMRKVIGQEKYIFFALLLYNFLLFFLCTKLSPLYDFNEWSDLNIYFNIGKGMLNGLVPYRDLFDHKGPLIFLIYGIGYLISNTSFTGVYIIESLFFFVGSSAAYLLTRHHLNRLYAFIAAVCFPLAGLFYTSQGGSAEEFIVTIQAVSLLFFVRYFQISDNRRQGVICAFVQGILLSLVFFIKMNLVVYCIPLLLTTFLYLLFRKEYYYLIRSILFFLFGFLVVTFPIVIYFLFNSALTDFWNGYFEFNFFYANVGAKFNVDFILGIIARFVKLLWRDPLFLITTIGVAIYCISPKFLKNNYARLGLVFSFFFMVFVVLMSPVVMGYYYTSFTVFSVFFCIVLFYFIHSFFKFPEKNILFVLVFIMGLGLGCLNKKFYGESIDVLTRKEKPHTVEISFSDIIRKEPAPSLLCLGVDRGLGVFTKTGILPNVKYFFYPNIHYDSYPEIRDSQANYIKERKIQFVIIKNTFLYYNYFVTQTPLNENYEVIDSFKQPEGLYLLYRRKDR